MRRDQFEHAIRAEAGSPHRRDFRLFVSGVVTYNRCVINTYEGRAMNTKLTLRLDDRLILKAKRYSERSGKSVSQLVADYFSLIDADEEIPGTEISPRVRSLIGGFKGATTTEDDYRRHLEEKYR